jgi:hypothetical protein
MQSIGPSKRWKGIILSYVAKSGKRQHYRAASRELIAREFSKISNEVVAEMAKRSVEKEAYLQKEIIFLEGVESVRAAFADVVSRTVRGETFYRYTSEKDQDAVNRMLPKDYRAL